MTGFGEKTPLFVKKYAEGHSFFIPSQRPKEREGYVLIGVSRPSMAKGCRLSVIRSTKRGKGHKPAPLFHFNSSSFTS